jgi:ADP-ribosylglycohydrolase
MKIKFLGSALILLMACYTPREQRVQPTHNEPQKKESTKLSREVYYNKVLGMLIGSAIGDAMGAPTEGWARKDIQVHYGFVEGLDTMVRASGAEGPWKFNLPAGGSTDDTRWKKLFVNYALSERWLDFKPENFAHHIVEEYKSDIKNLTSTQGFHPEAYEENLMKMAWLQEWALVGDAYQQNDMKKYADAVSKFYGGEMVCGGMLYSPVIGACLPSDVTAAYQTAYDLAIFDIGYARDITALVAAMTSQAFDSKVDKASLAKIIRTLDPKDYFKSRLVGRASYNFYQLACNIVSEAKNLSEQDIPKPIKIPREWQPMNTLEYLQLTRAYSLLDKYNEDSAFHAGEIYLITITAMMFADYDFEKTMQFIINYGRDNDTVGAVAGAILGAYWGAEGLPEKMKKQTIKVHKEILETDLEDLALRMTNKYLE